MYTREASKDSFNPQDKFRTVMAGIRGESIVSVVWSGGEGGCQMAVAKSLDCRHLALQA